MRTLWSHLYVQNKPCSLLIEKGKIQALIEEGHPLPQVDQTLDAGGGHLYPGFVDAHMHLLGYGLSLDKVSLEGTTTIEAIIERCKNHLEDHPLKEGDFLLGQGWNQTYLEGGQMPTKEDLDRISTEIPILLSRNCHHVLVANSAAILLLNEHELSKKEKNLGLFEEEAMAKLLKKVPRPGLEDIKEAILRAQEKLLSFGITSVFSDDLAALQAGEEDLVFEAFASLEEEGLLVLNVYEQSLFRSSERFERALAEGYQMDPPGRRFRRGPLKILLDGSLGARTARLRASYSDDPTTRGLLNHSPEEFRRQVALAGRAGVDLAVHGIGDETISLALETIESEGTPRGRHAIVHAQITAPDLLQRFSSTGIGAMIQPIFIDDDIFVVKDRLGDRIKGSYAFRTLYRTVPTALSTDAPIVSPNPFDCLFTAITRQDLGRKKSPFLPEEALSIREALDAYQRTAYHFSYEEGQKGQLAPGQIADLCILDRCLEDASPEDLRDTQVLYTLVDGEVHYKGN